ncbi:MAG: TraB/GumN family protein [Pseudomonadota bacterium]
MHSQGVFMMRRPGPAVLLAGVLFFLLAAITRAETDKSHGLLWEISKPGQEPAYLFGTIHSEDPEVVDLPAPVRQAFDAADSVVLEMLMDTEAMMYSSTAMLMLDGRSLPDVLGMPLYKRVTEAIASRGIPELVLNRMKPWAAAVTLSMPALETGQILDLVLYQDALQQDKAVYGLETVREQLDLFDSMPESDQVTLLKDAVDNLPELDAMHAELLAAYKQRDLDGLLAINETSMQAGDQQLAKDLQRRVIDDRNQRMAERMQQYLQQGKAFVAVGALHLPGEKGLLDLLEQQGYTVRRVY